MVRIPHATWHSHKKAMKQKNGGDTRKMILVVKTPKNYRKNNHRGRKSSIPLLLPQNNQLLEVREPTS